MIEFNPVGGTVQALKLELKRFFNDFGRFFYEKKHVYTKEEVDALLQEVSQRIQVIEDQIAQLMNE